MTRKNPLLGLFQGEGTISDYFDRGQEDKMILYHTSGNEIRVPDTWSRRMR